jgi:hypothetical protein
MEERATALPPSRVVGLRVREFRTHRNGHRWTQERLAQELREVGIQIGQTDVARLEKLPGDTGKDPRPVTLEDWLALAFVLDVPPLALLLPKDQERVAILPKGVRPRDPEGLEYSNPPPGPVRPLPRTYSGERRAVEESRDRMAAWIVGRAPLNAQREPRRYKSYGRQDAQQGGQRDLGTVLRDAADLLDSEDFDGQEEAIQGLRGYLEGVLTLVRLQKAHRDQATSEKES